MATVALVGPEVEENLSLRYLAAALGEQGFASEIVPFNAPPDLTTVLERVLAIQPLVVGLSLSFQWRAQDVLALAMGLRDRGYRGHITGGGHFAAFAWPELLRDFHELDSICLHEAEETLPALVKAVAEGCALAEIAGLASRGPDGPTIRRPPVRVPDLARVRWPDRRGEPTRCLGHAIAPMVTSRGCYARCEFCCIAAWHEQTLPGTRYRSRPLDDVADEMAWLGRERRTEIFIFHDDNFLLPGERGSLDRIDRLAKALGQRGMGRFASVVKARPTDLTPAVLEALVARLGLVRVYLGVETDSAQGLRTLGRGMAPGLSREVLRHLDERGVYACFNMLLFDPDTTLESLERNLTLLEQHAQVPHNFGRVELYAGTPLLARMLGEGRCSGDYLGWDYTLNDPLVQRVFEITMACFHDRNFGLGSMANRLMGTRFDVEVCRFFHPGTYRDDWLREAQRLNRALTQHSLQAVREIVAFVRRRGSAAEQTELVERLTREIGRKDAELRQAATRLEDAVQQSVGQACRHACP